MLFSINLSDDHFFYSSLDFDSISVLNVSVEFSTRNMFILEKSANLIDFLYVQT